MEFRKQIDSLVKGSLACVEAMCILRDSIQVWDSDSYDCMDNLCKAYAHFADNLTILVKSDDLSEMPKE